MKTPWDFVERYYQNFHSCDLIAESDDLSKILDEEFEVGDSSHKLLIHKYYGDVTNPQISIDYNNIMIQIYEKAIRRFIKSQEKKS